MRFSISKAILYTEMVLMVTFVMQCKKSKIQLPQESINNFTTEFNRAATLMDERKFDRVIEVFESLLTENFPDSDKSVLWVNIALARAEMGDFSLAIKAYDKAIEKEKSFDGHWASFSKAVYLAEINRELESISIFELLLKRNDLKKEEKDAIINNLKTLRQRIH